MSGPAFLFVFDGTLMDSVYHHVLACQETLVRARSVMVMSAYEGEHVLDAMRVAKPLRYQAYKRKPLGD
jgi:beta-phosphoglucomutase-like phosphatase (HAD superfamily)